MTTNYNKKEETKILEVKDQILEILEMYVYSLETLRQEITSNLAYNIEKCLFMRCIRDLIYLKKIHIVRNKVYKGHKENTYIKSKNSICELSYNILCKFPTSYLSSDQIQELIKKEYNRDIKTSSILTYIKRHPDVYVYKKKHSVRKLFSLKNTPDKILCEYNELDL